MNKEQELARLRAATPPQLLEALLELLKAAYGDGTARFLEACRRMLGKPVRWVQDESEVWGTETITHGHWEEASGLHKYGANHLLPEWKGWKHSREEAFDITNQMGVLTDHRLKWGLEKFDDEQAALRAEVLYHNDKALTALERLCELRGDGYEDA